MDRFIFFGGPNTSSFTLQLFCLPFWLSLPLTTVQVKTWLSGHGVGVPRACAPKDSAWDRVRDGPRQQHSFLHFKLNSLKAYNHKDQTVSWSLKIGIYLWVLFLFKNDQFI